MTSIDGSDITVSAINADGTLGSRFTSGYGWLTQNGKLPWLFGNAVELPAYLNLSASSLPYAHGFESVDEQWILLNGTQTNKWNIHTFVKNGGSRSLYISNNTSGNNNDYSGSTSSHISYVYAYRTLNFTSTGTHTIKFDWKSVGESSWDIVRAF